MLTNPIKLQIKIKNSKSMRAGSLNLLFIIILTSLFQSLVFSHEKITLQDIQPTFEEETEISIKDSEANYSKLKSKRLLII